MTDDNLRRLLAYRIALGHRQLKNSDMIEGTNLVILREMQARDVKSFEHGEFELRRIAVPVNACRLCGTALETPQGIDPSFIPERIAVRKKAQNVA